MAEKKKAEQRLVPNAEGNVRVEAIMGPYRGQHLTMTAADGQGAINDHWARDPTEALYEHEELSEEDRTHAVEAAHIWAKTQWDAAAGVEPLPPDPPPEGGVTRKRSMEAEHSSEYKTRSR